MKIAVKDANVFIDLEAMGLLDLWFQVGITTLTSSFVVMELEDGGHENALACIRAGQAVEATISGEEMAGAFAEFQDAHGRAGLSETDLSVIYLAIREDAMVLSGDRLLRITARPGIWKFTARFGSWTGWWRKVCYIQAWQLIVWRL